MYVDGEEKMRDAVRRAATLSAIVGPMVALMLVGFLARLQNFFCPANFLPLYAASFVLLAPAYFLIGWMGAKSVLRLDRRGVKGWPALASLAVGGGVLGALYFEGLAFVLSTVLPDYGLLLTLPGLQLALSVAAALAATWSLLFRTGEPRVLSLR